MALSCREQAVRIEEEVLQPITQYVDERRKECRNEPCNWYMLCLNKLVCTVFWAVVKVVTWVVTTVVRWGTRIICVAVSLVIGLLAIFIGNFDIIIQALRDLIELFIDVIYFVIGAFIFGLIMAVDFVQTLFGIERKRALTKDEIEVLRPIFGDSLLYFLIRIVEEPGILKSIDGNPRAFTIGYNIYPPVNSMTTLVHECVHVWQFQYGGTQYIGQSMVQQAIGGRATYDWRTAMGQGDNAWYLLDSNEAKASFIDNVFSSGTFNLDDGSIDDSDGAFFTARDNGANSFIDDGEDYTVRANHAWSILKT
jgi:hypothetical protein